MMGTNAFHCHAYSELYLDGKWVKAAPVFDVKTCKKGNFFPMVEFDGEHDALFAPLDIEGNKFVEYIADWGNYADVPQKKIVEIFTEKYPTWFSSDTGMSTDVIIPIKKEPLSLDK